MLLVIDNYDSFTYNLVQYLGELGAEMRVFRNDEITIEEIENDLKPDKILISPGPGTPDDAGVSLEVLEKIRRARSGSRRLFRSSGNRTDFRRKSCSCARSGSRETGRNRSRRENSF